MFNINGNNLNLFTIFLIGVALSMDACAVGLSCGILKKRYKIIYPLKLSFSFGFFQFGMVFLGYFLGINLIHLISKYDHWVAFLILIFVGFKMIFESFKQEDKKNFDPEKIKTIVFLSFATSIDAFAVGVSLSLLKIKILFPSILIGVITFTLSLFSVYFGQYLTKFFRKGAEIIGGLILISIGIKILLEHLL